MFKLVVLSVLVAVAACAPRPGLVHSEYIPTAISHQSRIDVHNPTTLLTAYSIAAPVAHHAHLAYSALPAAVSHSSRVDLHQTTLLASPVVAAHGVELAYAALPAIHGW